MYMKAMGARYSSDSTMFEHILRYSSINEYFHNLLFNTFAILHSWGNHSALYTSHFSFTIKTFVDPTRRSVYVSLVSQQQFLPYPVLL